MNKKMFRSLLLLILFTALLFFVMNNFGVVWEILGFIITVIMPFIIGLFIAFIINKPYMFFAERAYAGLAKKGPALRKVRKPLALITAYIIVFGIIAFLIGILLPQLGESIEKLIKNFSGYVWSFQNLINDFQHNEWIIRLFGKENDLFGLVNEATKFLTGGEIAATLQKLTATVGPSIFSFMTNMTTNIYNVIMGIIVSFYFLACKDKLLYQTKKFTFAYAPPKALPKIMEISELTNKMFGRYIYGRVINSSIIGILCFIFMSIFNWHYPLLISVIIGITDIIPVFGPFLGAVPSIFILLIIDPWQALWFTVFIIILQQVDGNFIGPRIVGSSIGISGFWIMVSVIIGGGLFGIVGMFIAVPIFAIIYSLVGAHVNKRIQESPFSEELGQEPSTDILSDKKKVPFRIRNITILQRIKKEKGNKEE